MPKIYFVSVDVGTTSARAALVTSHGKVVQQAVQPIKIWNPEHEHYEQSSEDIWSAVCKCVSIVTSEIVREEVVAISFDATCSLVILGENGVPLSVSCSFNPEQNVLLWMDHRAHAEAATINATNHELLDFVGGQVSVEMEMPKLLWLKKNVYMSTWTKLWRAFELPDYLTWRSTGSDSRSLCSVLCKWNYDGKRMCWNEEFLSHIGLNELCANEYEIIGNKILAPGEAVGQGLCEQAAEQLNLLPGTVVGTSLIDAHAGALALFGCRAENDACMEGVGAGSDVQNKLALICGTSTCHMSLTHEPCLARGVWGPYHSAIIPGYHLNEGGQSATGLLLDHIIKSHPQYIHIKLKLHDKECVYKYLYKILVKMADERQMIDPCYLTKDLHVIPDFHGNRSPIADPNLRGMISGQCMSIDDESLATLYLAFVQALAYGTRHIIENLLRHARVPFETLLFGGGLAKNALYVQCHADICQLPAIVPNEQEMMLVGGAALGATAAKVYASLEAASAAMGGTGKRLKPRPETYDYHNRKYAVFRQMLRDQQHYKALMEQ